MAYAFADYWGNFTNGLTSTWGSTDSRGNGIRRNALSTGTNYIASINFDYFTDTPVANDYIVFQFPVKWWGLKLYVGTAFVADAVTFIWEYTTGPNTWSELIVDNPNAFLSTGEQTINFTPPYNLSHGYEYGLSIRCRIVSVTNPIEGGANSTQRVQFNLKHLQITGNNQTFANAYTADLAGTYKLLDTTPAANLKPLFMPVRATSIDSRVDVVLTGCTLGAGDTVNIAGKDILNNDVSETIDVSGGNGTFTSVGRYSHISDVDCNGFNDGNIKINQKRWGIIQRTNLWDQHSNNWNFGASLIFGDGSTATTFSTTRFLLNFNNYHYFYLRQATVTFGATSTTQGETYGRSGGVIYEKGSIYTYVNFLRNLNSTTSTLTMNGVIRIFEGNGLRTNGPFSYRANLTATFRDFENDGSTFAPVGNNTTTYVRAKFLSGVNLNGSQPAFGSKNFITFNQLIIERNNSSTDIFENLVAPSIFLYLYNGRINIVNSPVPLASFSNYFGVSTVGTGLWLQFTYKAKVIDEKGNPIQGAKFVFRDAFKNIRYTLTSDASGNIAKTAIDYVNKMSNPAKTDYYSPYIVTITKTGYETKKIKYDMSSEKDVVIKLDTRRKV